ncbi:DNA polymerase III subunit epsilon [Uruburuella testudinis]|uniref:DNA polymerase III subunit epsilon n=1 Tax=Uruburuella testudinis TaxID=1282863 RepID=A0ABY4DV79_9NEIS|nr:DNA polymerase III subunit epsilon [Uruburuella testudinis]UOO82575.1 DNA polymerase III subunit epsilon [Uruburuella testudinis]
MSQRQIILDTETTGLYAGSGDRLVEFAGLEMTNRHFTGKNLHLYVHPERDMPEEAAAVHGLTIDVLEEKNAPVFAEVGQQIADFLRGAELIIHNAKFDVGFLNMEFQRMGLPTIEALGCTVTDTLAMARQMFPGQKASLDALCTRFEVDRSKRVYHGALIDCELLGEVYLAMTRGQFSLADSFAESAAEAAVNRRPRPEYLKVVQPNEAELAEHEAYLDTLEKTSDGHCAWRPKAAEAGA